MRVLIAFIIMLLGVAAIFSDRAWRHTSNWWRRLRFAYQYPALHRRPVRHKVRAWLGSKMALLLATVASLYSNIPDLKSSSSTPPEPTDGTVTEDPVSLANSSNDTSAIAA